jgi:hypothetical protein
MHNPGIGHPEEIRLNAQTARRKRAMGFVNGSAMNSTTNAASTKIIPERLSGCKNLGYDSNVESKIYQKCYIHELTHQQ